MLVGPVSSEGCLLPKHQLLAASSQDRRDRAHLSTY